MVWFLEMENLAAFLVTKKIITSKQAESILFMQKKSGSSLPELLLSEFMLNPKILYQAIAEFYGVEFADLQQEPCNADILDKNQRNNYLKIQALPWKIKDGAVVIAVTEINDSLQKWAEANFAEYEFAITSPFDISTSINNIFAVENDIDAREMLLKATPEYSANNLFSNNNNKANLAVLALIAAALAIFPHMVIFAVFAVVTMFYACTIITKTMLFLIGWMQSRHVEELQKFLEIADRDLPVYTILVPLYKEERVLEKLVNAIKNLDYPKSKLDVKLIVEEDDAITYEAIKGLKCERIFEIITVPFSLPRTKPKACNYALRFAKGEFVTIYDAEDVPEPLQLKKALYSFYHEPPDVVCVQARLAYFNREENLLSRMFAIEYSILFDFMLFGLMAMQIPIPLGGTSNHFKTATLRELYAWDPYNVTEDADLGLRIAQKNWRSVVIDSYTMEECPITLGAWIRQRSRWIKGHMQTYFVHMRRPFNLLRKVGVEGFFGIQFFLGAPILIFIISPIMWLLWLVFVVFGSAKVPVVSEFLGISYLILSFGVAVQVLSAAIAILRNDWRGMLIYSLAFPFYWILHSIAAFRAVAQLITRPHYWEKTSHGVTKVMA